MISHDFSSMAIGFLRTRITESPRRNILEMNRSLATGFPFFFCPFPGFGSSVHISFTFSRTMLQWRSKALTRANNLRLFRQLISTWVLFLTDWVRTESGPVENSSSSRLASSSGVISFLGFVRRDIVVINVDDLITNNSKQQCPERKQSMSKDRQTRAGKQRWPLFERRIESRDSWWWTNEPMQWLPSLWTFSADGVSELLELVSNVPIFGSGHFFAFEFS